MITGIGIDIILIERIKKLIDTYKNRFLERYFTESEIHYCNSKVHKHIHFAGKYAAKEAVYKALKMRWCSEFKWRDIEITNPKCQAPEVSLHGFAETVCKAQNVSVILLSISHDRAYAVAVAAMQKKD
jgi:holo-[acyl-carrier protein] synthase